MRKRNKLIFFVVSLILIMFLSSCFIGDGNIYKLNFYYQDYILTFDLNEYESGKSYDLPSLDGSFEGWYFDSDFSGEVQEKIYFFQRGDLNYYAKYGKDDVGNNELSKYINNTNKFSISSSDEALDYYMVYDNGNFEYKTNSGSDYLFLRDDVWYYADYDYQKGEFVLYSEHNEEFEKFVSELYFFNFSFLDSIYLKNNEEKSCFEVYDHFADIVFSRFFNQNKKVKNLKFYYNDNYFTSVSFEVCVDSNNQVYKTSAFTLYDHDKVNIVIPDISSSVLGIKTDTNTYTVPLGTSFEEACSNVSVLLYYENGFEEFLDLSDCEFSSTNYNLNDFGFYEVNVKYLDYEFTFNIKISDEAYGIIYADSYEYLHSLKDDYNYTIGLNDQSKVLVLPVEFNDYPADSDMVENLEKAFFGTADDTGWESLKSYYYKSSYGAVNISGTVLPVFDTNKSSRYYELIDEDSAINSIIKAALELYDSSINYDDYDSDNDGFIDALYIIYTAPIDYYGDSLYWAFSYEYFTEEEELYDGVEADFYAFIGYEFFFEELANGQKINLNTETLIHETGHLFGLDDYYDYNYSIGPDGGLGGGDMMDNNVGDHNPYSKAILGWVEPTIVDSTLINTDFDIVLRPFESSGDCVAVFKDWDGSLFGEYFMIDFYMPKGLNALEAGHCGLFSDFGIRIYHINSTLKDSISSYNSVWELTRFNNSDTSTKLIRLVQADGLNEIEKNNAYSGNNDLFHANALFTNISWTDKSLANFEIFVKSLNYEEAVITIRFIG